VADNADREETSSISLGVSDIFCPIIGLGVSVLFGATDNADREEPSNISLGVSDIFRLIIGLGGSRTGGDSKRIFVI
jgi:hypothetical protein